MNLSSLFSSIINLVYPSCCPSCGISTDNFGYAPFCSTCWKGIRQYIGPSCSICNVPLASVYAKTCSDCLKEPPAFKRLMSYGIYEGVLASSIHSLKFGRIKRLAKPLSKLLLCMEFPSLDGIIPVPLTVKGLRERGFNQTLLLSRSVSTGKGIPLFATGLIKVLETKPQIGLSADERRRNIRGAFRPARDFKGMKLLIVDDVVTTGATVNECSKTLLKAGAAEVFVMALARAGLP